MVCDLFWSVYVALVASFAHSMRFSSSFLNPLFFNSYAHTFANDFNDVPVVKVDIHRGVEQLVARWAHNPKVTGSSPVPATEPKEDVS